MHFSPWISMYAYTFSGDASHCVLICARLFLISSLLTPNTDIKIHPLMTCTPSARSSCSCSHHLSPSLSVLINPCLLTTLHHGRRDRSDFGIPESSHPTTCAVTRLAQVAWTSSATCAYDATLPGGIACTTSIIHSLMTLIRKE